MKLNPITASFDEFQVATTRAQGIETAGRFGNIPRYELTDNPIYDFMVNDMKGIVLFTTFYAFAFIGAFASAKIEAALPTDFFELPFDQLKENTGNARTQIPGIRVRKLAKSCLVTIPCGNLPSLGFIISRLRGMSATTEEEALRSIISGLYRLNPSLVEAKPLDYTVPAAQVFRNHRGFEPDLIKLEYQGEDEDLVGALNETVQSIRIMGPAPKYSLPNGTTISSFKKLSALTGHDFVIVARQILSHLGNCVLSCVYELPAAWIEHITQTPFKEVKLQYVSAWMSSMMEYGLNGEAEGYTETLNPISVIAQATKTSRIRQVKRTNEHGLLVTQKGILRFVPEVGVDAAVSIEKQVEEGSTTADGEFTAVDVIEPDKTHYEDRLNAAGQVYRARKSAGRNKAVFTDWYQGKFSYTLDSGKLKVDDLTTCRPATATHIAKILQNDIAAMKPLLSHLGTAAKAIGFKMASEVPADIAMWFYPDQRSDVQRAISDSSVVSFLGKIDECLQRKYRGGVEQGEDELAQFLEEEWSVRRSLLVKNIGPESPVLPLRFVFRLAEYVATNHAKRFNDIAADCGVWGATLAIAVAQLIYYYAPNHKSIAEEDAKLRSKYVAPELDSPQELKVAGVPFVKGLTLLPQQVKVFNYLKNLPDHAVIDVQAGGGKTVIALVDIALNLKKGTVRKPLIACPSDLIKNYYIDANKAFGGRVNIIAITTITARSWGYDKLRELINAAPINTIFITGFEFAAAGREDYGYGTSNVSTSSNLEFLQEFPWDGLWIDEAHKLKNGSSVRTRMMMQVASSLNIVRQMSGTYMPDSYEDVVAMFAQLEPTVFGDLKRFNETYRSDEKGRKKWIPNAGRMIRNEMREHANVITVKRREWMSLLPPVEDAYHGVSLDPKVQKIYEDLVAEEIEKIKAEIAEKNPKLKKAIETGIVDDEDMEEQLEHALDSSIHMARLEEFLCDPLADEAGFAITDERLGISPKIRKVHELIQQHRQKGIRGKVLIFAKNHVAANAVYKYAPTELKKHIMLYKASGGTMTKDQYLQEFETNPDYWALVGVEDSLNTGRNLQFCFPQQTQVLVDYDKSLSIGELYENKSVTHVLSYDLKSRKIEKRKIIKRIRHKVAPTDVYVNVTVRDDKTGEVSSITCTDNHHFFLMDGSEVEAGKLVAGSKLITYGGNFTQHYAYEDTGELVSQYDWSARRSASTPCSECGTRMPAMAMQKHMSDVHHLTVVKVAKSWSKRNIGEYKYDLEVEGNHNYFACAGSNDPHYKLIPVLVHNCSRLIRIQAVWNYGALEQGEARVLRPNVENETRDKIYMDFIFTDATIDVTKASRMIAKLVSTAKWYEPDDPRFQSLPDLDPVRMSLDNIASFNSWDQGDKSLRHYIEGLVEYRNAERLAYEDFKANPNNFVKSQKLEDGGVLPGSAILAQVPYIPGIELYGMDELGLIKYSVYESENRDPKTHAFDPAGLIIHTEDGEGECVGSSSERTLRVSINGKNKNYNKDSVFVVRKRTAKAIDVRRKMAELVGSDTSRYVNVKVPPKAPKNVNPAPIPNTDLEANSKFNVYAVGYNEMIALGVDGDDPDVPVADLKKMGFIPLKPYHYTQLANWRQLKRWFDIADSKFSISGPHRKRLLDAIEIWKASKDLNQFLKRLTPEIMKDFLRAQIKVLPKGEIRPYLVVDSGDVYLCIDEKAHVASWSAIRKITGPGISWEEGLNELFCFCTSKADAKQLLADLGRKFTITNLVKTSKKLDDIRVIGTSK